MKPILRYLKRSQIDEAKWNDVIANSVSGLPYAYSWYLDCVAPEWRGLVYGDYEIVMPIPVGTKFGIKYVYQPLFCQQLGAFSKQEIKPAALKKMIELVTKKYYFIHQNLNYSNTFDNIKKKTARKNLILPLYTSYEEIKKRYSDNLTRNIKRAHRKGLQITGEEDGFVEFYIENTAVRDDNFKSQHKEQLKNLVEQLKQHNMARLLFVKNREQKLSAAGLFVETPTRIINLLPATNDRGRANGAMHFLIDSLLQESQNSKRVFDFEGSSVLSIARFYKSFGAKEETFDCVNKKLIVL